MPRPGEQDDLEGALDETVAEVELEESLDRIERPAATPTTQRPRTPERACDEEDLLTGLDPEAGVMNVSRRRQVRRLVMSEGTQFIGGILIALIGVATVVLAATLQTRPYVIAAAVIAPPAFVWFFIRWKRWLGQAPYFYRLLTSLGEDADELLEAHRRKQEARLDRKIEKHRQRTGHNGPTRDEPL